MKSFQTLLIASIPFLSLPAAATELDLALSNETAAAELITASEQLNVNGASLTLGGEYNDNDDLLGYIGLASSGANFFGQSQPVQLGVGGRLYYAAIDEPDENAAAVALGGHGRINFSGLGSVPLALAGSLYLAPDITTFMDGDDFFDARLRLEADVAPNATAFVGYREVKVGLKSAADQKIDENFHAGVRFKF